MGPPDQSIRLHDKLLLVLSASSIGSEWVEDEVTTTFERTAARQDGAVPGAGG